MITELTKDWDDAIRNCFFNCGPGINDHVLNRAIIHVVENMVNDCCEIISQNKKVHLKAEYKIDLVNIMDLSVYVIFNVFDQAEKVNKLVASQKYPYLNINTQGKVYVKIKLPRSSASFNEEPQEWYRETIELLWNGYKDYMKEKFNA